MTCDRAELDAFYRRYLQCCNEHRFGELGELGELGGENVEVNGEGIPGQLRLILSGWRRIAVPCGVRALPVRCRDWRRAPAA